MRLENYYVLIIRQNGCTVFEAFNTLELLLNNIDLNDKEEYEGIEIIHKVENYSGDFNEDTLYYYENGNVKTIDEEIKAFIEGENSLTCTKEITYDYDTDENGINTEFVVVDGKKYIDIDYFRIKIDELQGQFDYECECNKDLVKTQKENDRLKVLLANAITCLEEEQTFDTHERLLDYLGMTEEEYKEIMGGE